MRVVVVSGGFDPVHVGHVRMFKEARKLGDRLIVILNNDDWLVKKKGYAFMPEEERKEIIQSFACVDKVVLTEHLPNDDDASVCRELDKIFRLYIKDRDKDSMIFANGGDRKADNIPEYNFCEAYRIEMVFNVGGGKVQSSSELVKAAMSKVDGAWGDLK